MGRIVLDDVDKGILYRLQQDAFHATTTELGDQVGVSVGTVSNRIDQLEDDGIITNYFAAIDYERAGFNRHFLVACTAPISEREELAQQALELPGVVHVRELLTGERNLSIEVVGRSTEDITAVVTQLTEMGLQVNDEIMIRAEYYHPLSYLDTAADP